MLRFASSLFQRRDKPKPRPKEKPVELSGPGGVPYWSGNSSTSSSTSFSVRTPDDSADRAVPIVSGSPLPKWKSVFKSKKGVSSSKSLQQSAKPSTYFNPRNVSQSIRFHQPSASFFDSDHEYLSPPIRPFVHTPESSRSANSSPQSSRSSLVGISTAHSNLHALILNSLQPTLSPHPFLYIPAEPIYPRSCNPFNSHPPTPSTLRHQVLRTRLLKRLETYTFTPTEERSVRPPTASRPRRTPKAQIGLTEVEAMVRVDSGGWSRGVHRWVRRTGFEERNAVWMAGKNGTLMALPITGAPIAALEFSAGVEALAGLGDNPLQTQLIPEHGRESNEDVNMAALLPASRAPTPSTSSSSRVSRRNMPPPTVPAVPKRGVRFASISSESDTDPPILIVHPSTPAEELEIESPPRANVLRLDTPKLTIDVKRRAQEQARRREEAVEQARRREEAQRKFQEEVVAARLRRESFKLDGGSSSVRAWNDFGQKMDPLATGSVAAVTARKPGTRRSATDPDAMSLSSRRGSWAPPLHVPLPLSPADTSVPRRGSGPSSPPSSSPGSPRPHRLSIVSSIHPDPATAVPSHLSPSSAAHSTSGRSEDPRLLKRESLTLGDSSQTRLDDTRSTRSLSRASRSFPSPAPPLPTPLFPTGFYPSYPTPPMGAPMVVMQPVYIMPPQIVGSMFPWGPGPAPIGATQSAVPSLPSQGAGAVSPRPLNAHRRSQPPLGRSSAHLAGSPRPPQSQRDPHPT